MWSWSLCRDGIHRYPIYFSWFEFYPVNVNHRSQSWSISIVVENNKLGTSSSKQWGNQTDSDERWKRFIRERTRRRKDLCRRREGRKSPRVRWYVVVYNRNPWAVRPLQNSFNFSIHRLHPTFFFAFKFKLLSSCDLYTRSVLRRSSLWLCMSNSALPNKARDKDPTS